MAAAAVAPGALDLFEDRGGGGDFQPGAAIFFRDQNREVAGLGERIDKGLGIGHLAIELAPVLARILLAQLGNRQADIAMVVVLDVRLNIHGVH